MSCLSRIGCVTVLAVGGVAVWLYSGATPDLVRRAASSIGASAPRNEPRPVHWTPVAESGTGVAETLAVLEHRTGPAYITLAPDQIANFLHTPLLGILPPAAEDTQVAVVDDLIRVRGTVALRDLGADALPGLLKTVLDGAMQGRPSDSTIEKTQRHGERDTVELGGTLEVIRPGFAQYRVRLLRLGAVSVPERLIPSVLTAIRGKAAPGDSVTPAGIAIVLPKSIADVRIARGQVTLYKAVPPK